MGFKENLKSELTYAGMTVKELAAKTGIKKHTLDNYLNTHNSLPNAEAAVKIAQALKVSLEYLVTGGEKQQEKTLSSLGPDLRLLINTVEKLSPKNRQLALKLVKAIEDQEEPPQTPPAVSFYAADKNEESAASRYSSEAKKRKGKD